MKSTTNLFFLFTICTLVVTGCGSPSSDQQAIKKAICKFQYQGKSYELLHAACYVVEESDGPVKCVLFSNSPIDVPLLQKELQEEGKPLCQWYYSKDATTMLCFRDREYGVSVEVTVGRLSMGIGPDKIESTLSYSQGHLAGKIVTTAPIDDGTGSKLEFAAQLNQQVVYSSPKQVDL